MAVQLWSAPAGPLQGIAGAAYASSVTLTDVSPGGTANPLVIPAASLVVGSQIVLEAWGTFSNTATPTLLLGFYWGGVAGTALAATSATTTTTAATSWTWQIRWHGVVQATGTSGKVIGSGHSRFPTSLTAWTEKPLPETAPAQVTIDTTTNKAVTVGAQWGTSSASNTLTCQALLVTVHG